MKRERRLAVSAAIWCFVVIAAFMLSACSSSDQDVDQTKIKEVVTETQTTTAKKSLVIEIPNTGDDEHSPRY